MYNKMCQNLIYEKSKSVADLKWDRSKMRQTLSTQSSKSRIKHCLDVEVDVNKATKYFLL